MPKISKEKVVVEEKTNNTKRKSKTPKKINKIDATEKTSDTFVDEINQNIKKSVSTNVVNPWDLDDKKIEKGKNSKEIKVSNDIKETKNTLKKTRRSKPGSNAIKEIKKQQKNSSKGEPVFKRKPLERLIREIASEYSTGDTGIRFKGEAINIIIEQVTTFGCRLMSKIVQAMRHRKRQTFTISDMLHTLQMEDGWNSMFFGYIQNMKKIEEEKKWASIGVTRSEIINKLSV